LTIAASSAGALVLPHFRWKNPQSHANLVWRLHDLALTAAASIAAPQ